MKHHLEREHNIKDMDAIQKKGAVQVTIEATLAHAHDYPQKRRRKQDDEFSMDVFEGYFVRWVTRCGIAFVHVRRQEFRDMMEYASRHLDDGLPRSDSTVRDWVKRRFESEAEKVKLSIKESLSRIHISVDLWTSPNHLPMLGIIAHYVSSKGEKQQSVIGLRKVEGDHGGQNQARIVLNIIREYGFVDNLGYFMGDNAESNETLCQHLSECKKIYSAYLGLLLIVV